MNALKRVFQQTLRVLNVAFIFAVLAIPVAWLVGKIVLDMDPQIGDLLVLVWMGVTGITVAYNTKFWRRT